MTRHIITSKNAVFGHDDFIGEVLNSDTCTASIEWVVAAMEAQGSTEISWYVSTAGADVSSETIAHAAAARRNKRD